MSRVEPPDLSADVVTRALDGDPVAFTALYRRYDPTVRWAVGLRVYRWPQLVPQLEDIVQEVWCELTRRSCKRLRYHDPAHGVPLWRFVALVSSRFGWRVAKRQLGHPEIEIAGEREDEDLDAEDWDFVARLVHAELVDRLAEQVGRELGEIDRALFEGYYVRGERLKDVGARLGMNENATYKRKERLQKKLQGLADGLLGESSRPITPQRAAMMLAMLYALTQSGLGGGA